SRLPWRQFSMSFRGDQRDVYEESRKYEQERQAFAARGLAALQQPELRVFTNLFRVEDATEHSGSTSGVYFFGSPEWRADLIPKEPIGFNGMAEVIFQTTNDIVQVGIAPADLL